MPSTPEFAMPALPHRNEIRSDFELRIGRHINLHGSATISPVGVLCAGISVAAMTLALGYAAGSISQRLRHP